MLPQEMTRCFSENWTDDPRPDFRRPATAAGRRAFLPSRTSEKMACQRRPVRDATAADGGMAELMMAEMGAKKATNPELKKFSEHMIESPPR